MGNHSILTPLLDEKQTAEYLGLSRRTLQAWRYNSQGPKYIRMGKAVRYRLADLDEFVSANSVDHG